MPGDSKQEICLDYRTSFLATLLVVGVVLAVLGPLVAISAVIIVQLQAIVAGVLMTAAGIHMLRHYLPLLRGGGRAYRIDATGVARIGMEAYEVPWRDVLGIHVRRRFGRPHDVFVYLKEDPPSPLFFRSIDPRAALFALRHPEAPNQIHFHLGHFKKTATVNIEERLAALAPRRGAFPPNAEILKGRLLSSWFLWPSVGFILTAVALFIYISSTHGPSPTILADIAAPWLVFMVLRTLWLRSRSGAAPCLIIAHGRLYLPATPLGSAAMREIINAKFRLGALMVMFSRSQPQIDSEGSHGMFAVAPIVLPYRSRTKIRELFNRHGLWKTGRKPPSGRSQSSTPTKAPGRA